jgi:hypothetical protein
MQSLESVGFAAACALTRTAVQERVHVCLGSPLGHHNHNPIAYTQWVFININKRTA